MKVVLTREEGRNEALRPWMPEGTTLSEVPLTHTRYVAIDDVARTLRTSAFDGSYRSLVLTSARAAPYVVAARDALASHARVFSVGRWTAQALLAYDVVSDVIGEGGVAALSARIDAGPVLALGAATRDGALVGDLATRQLEVTFVECYETVARELTSVDRATLGDADVVLVGAPSAWRVASAHVNESTWVVVPGATTAAAVRKSHARVLEGWGPALRERLAAL